MSLAMRNRILLLALILAVCQLALVVHATVHDSELSCQICLHQAHSSTGILPAKVVVPTAHANDKLVATQLVSQPVTNPPRAFLQRAPPCYS